MAPSICALLDQGYAESRAYHQNVCFEAAMSFTRAEGHIVAPETSHAVKAVYDEAMACKESGESKVILFNGSGHGHFDLTAYDAYLRHDLLDYEVEDATIQAALAELPKIPA
jgi:tryptophan synthase beta chain